MATHEHSIKQNRINHNQDLDFRILGLAIQNNENWAGESTFILVR